MNYHNPQNVKEEILPTDYRFLTVEEFKQRKESRESAPNKNIKIWGSSFWLTSQFNGFMGTSEFATYCVPLDFKNEFN